MVLELPAPSLQDPHQGLLNLSVPGLPTSRFSQRSSSSLGSSGWAEGTGTVPPHQLSWGCHCLAHGFPRTSRAPTLPSRALPATTPGHQTLALKEGPKRPPLSSQVSLLRDLRLAPRPRGWKAVELRPPPCCPGELQVWPPAHQASSSSSSSSCAQPCPALGPPSAAPGLYKACEGPPSLAPPPRELPAGTV